MTRLKTHLLHGILLSTMATGLSCSSSKNEKQTLPKKLSSQKHHMHDSSEAHHGEAHVHGARMHRFENAEKWAKEFDDPKRDQWQKPDEVIAVLNITPNMTVVDIGAGTGYFLSHISKSLGDTGQVIGLDVEQSMVDHMNQRMQNAEASNASARKVLPDDPALQINSVDRVLVVDTWHHIENRKEYVKKLHAALKANGTVTVVDFNQESPIGPPKQHRLLSEQVQGDFSHQKWIVKEAESSLPYQYIVVATKK